MNEILVEKLNQFEKSKDQECWYIVRQITQFDALCYLVDSLELYLVNQKNKDETSGESENKLATFISERATIQSQINPNFKFSNNYRALRVAGFFGLIKLKKGGYANAEISPVFHEIKQRCNGAFENTNLYKDIIQRQIEKMFISSEFDEEHERLRNNFRLYPVMLLYKVLLELGKTTGKYAVSVNEYRYFIATTEKFEDYIDALLLIKLSRESNENIELTLEKYKSKFDNRLIQVLKQLPTLDIDSNIISLVLERKDEVALKVYIFEQNPSIFRTEDYLNFLCSNQSLFELPNIPQSLISEINSLETASVDKHNKEPNNNTVGSNILLYGVPGVGKSYFINTNYCSDLEKMERVVFHPDYMNTDFIGQILPNITDGVINYEFVAGAFTRILKKAYNNPNQHYYLVIEELNRGNAPAIFGEVFQLMDRDAKGVSTYAIFNPQVAKIVYGDEDTPIKIPANLTILATMNTADQNVFTLDTAFQRRWQMRMIRNNIQGCEYRDTLILDTSVSWGKFNIVINNQITSGQLSFSSEDKQLGAYFISPDVLTQDILSLEEHNLFAEKVLKYLWDDVFKSDRELLFSSICKSLDSVVDIFTTLKSDDRFNIFNADIKEQLISDSTE
ncbi:Putative restriction enzyme [Enhydrobacter sp. AX1]|nr:AAA family ATPase [Enhydrobacter sp. AX1]VXB63196.1 Putative restriction enzyme [Enhydrobacter sp. AX1]